MHHVTVKASLTVPSYYLYFGKAKLRQNICVDYSDTVRDALSGLPLEKWGCRRQRIKQSIQPPDPRALATAPHNILAKAC